MPKNKEKGSWLEKGPVPALILVLVCAVCVSLLALTASVTAEARADQAERLANANKLALFPEASSFPSEKLEAAGQGIEGSQVLDLTKTHPQVTDLLVARAGDELQGMIISLSSKGYGGPLPVMVGFDLSGRILGLVVDAKGETAGLGQKVADSPFTGQFAGRDVMDPLEDIDGVASATISSDSVVRSVREAQEVFRTLFPKGGQQDG